ncbi:unnamed protein product [Arabis nemorensis]|uniref:Uncharacterized protein n=1 Tax=Arabis nemorensis TaxID=586526 RepID=A0A565BNA7_9BRAS|nr:unnamed protein product [Arabis nemorensis]
MNRSFRGKESLLLDSAERQRKQLRASLMADKDEELSLFLEMRRREKEQDNLLLSNPDEFETPLGSKPGTSPVFNISSGAPARKAAAPDDFLNSEGDKNDYEWLLTPPGTPLFPSLEMESHRNTMSQTGDSKSRPATLTSRLANSSTESASMNHLTSRQATSSPGLSSSSGASRRPSSSGGPGSRPATPTGRSSTLTNNSKSSRPSTPTSRATVSSTTRPSLTNSRSTASATTKPTPMSRSASSSRLTPTASKPTISTARSAGSATRSTTSTATKSAGPSRSTTPLSRSTARSSTPTSRPTLPPLKTISRSATPTRRPISSASAVTTTAKPTISQIKPSSPAAKPMPTPSKTPVSRGASPTVRSRPWKPSDMPGFSLETPPNLRTTLPERPLSATRGRPGAPSPRSGSVEPGGPTGGRPRRQSCSPSRGRAPMYSSGSSVPAVNRGYSKANDNISPVLMGTKMVERVINMRKLAPPRSDDNKGSPHGNLSAKSSSPDSAGFGRSLSKKSLDMAIRHMDIRRTIPGNLRPLMTNIPASSMYSVRSGHTRGRPMNVTDSPLATSSNASSEISVCNNNNGICLEASEKEDDAGSERGCRSPASLQGR